MTNPFGETSKEKAEDEIVQPIVQLESTLVDIPLTPVEQWFGFHCSKEVKELIIEASSKGGYKGYTDYLVSLVRRDPLVHKIMAEKAQ